MTLEEFLEIKKKSSATFKILRKGLQNILIKQWTKEYWDEQNQNYANRWFKYQETREAQEKAERERLPEELN